MSKSLFEIQFASSGYRSIAGVDEVGMGCLAGPVVAAAVILPPENIPHGIDDSKKLSAKRRETLDLVIRECAISFAIGIATVEEIDSINILRAAQLAMCRAIEALEPACDFLLIDGRFKINHPCPQHCVIKGDQLSVSIGAASILAKVYRDALMVRMDTQFPGYEFAKHKGYGSSLHRERLQASGPSAIHRKSFSWTPVRADSV